MEGRLLLKWMPHLNTTLCFKKVDVILHGAISTCTRIDAHMSGTLEMREMCPDNYVKKKNSKNDIS